MKMQRLEDHPDIEPMHPGYIFAAISGFATAFAGGVVELFDSAILEHQTSADKIFTRGAMGLGSFVLVVSLIAGNMFRSQKRS